MGGLNYIEIYLIKNFAKGREGLYNLWQST